MEVCLLEQASTPPNPPEGERISGRDRDAVRRERLAHPHRSSCKGVGRVLGARCDDCCRADTLGDLAHDRRPGVGRKRVEGVVLGDMRDLDRRSCGCSPCPRADQQPVGRPTEALRQRERLPRDVCRRAVGMLEQDEVHRTTPIRCRSSTTAGAASAPRPSTSASFA